MLIFTSQKGFSIVYLLLLPNTTPSTLEYFSLEIRAIEDAVINLPGCNGANDCERCFFDGSLGGISRFVCSGGDDLGLL